MRQFEIRTGDALNLLKEMADESVQCCVTSPPYWGLRDYGVEGQLGLERTPEEYVSKMVAVFREVRRVLRKDGTLWLNIGDSYAGSGAGGGKNGVLGSHLASIEMDYSSRPTAKPILGLKSKDLCGIPWLLAFALRTDGWYLRQDIIWSKPNPMPESVTDRCTKAHEYLFLLTKSARYYCDMEAIKEPSIYAGDIKTTNGNEGMDEGYDGHRTRDGFKRGVTVPDTRNKRSVWDIATCPFPEAHFATFPPDLIEPCIKAGTSDQGCCAECGAPQMRLTEKSVRLESGSGKAGNVPNGKYAGSEQAESGEYDIRMGPVTESKTIGWQPSCECTAATVPCTVLDPFNGAGTTGLVSLRLGRNYLGLELNPEYVAMASLRIQNDAPMFNHEIVSKEKP